MDEAEIARRLHQLESQVSVLQDAADAARRTRHDLLDTNEEFGKAVGSLLRDLDQIRQGHDSINAAIKTQARLLDSGMELTDDRFDYARETLKSHHRRIVALEQKLGIASRPSVVAVPTGASLEDLQEASKEVTQLAKKSSSGAHSVNINLQLGKLHSSPHASKPPGPRGRKTALGSIAAVIVAVTGLVTAIKACNQPAPTTVPAPK